MADNSDLVERNRRRGRGAQSNSSGRFEPLARSDFDDGWDSLEELEPFHTEVQNEEARTVITRNNSPDISFDRSINPYRGCEHGCSYCYARPTHAFMGLSPGLDFESKLFAKMNVSTLLERELADPNYQPAMIALGTNTDPYQPLERERRLTRSILEVLERYHHPVGIVTKSALVTRDIDILARMAERGLAKVALSVTTLDHRLSRQMEPRASSPQRRLEALKKLGEAGIPTGVMVAPIIPSLNDFEIEKILENVSNVGVREAGYVLLRLPLEVSELFYEWLEAECPDRAKRVITLIKGMRGGKRYDAHWQQRMRGTGPYAEQIARRFKLALKRFNLNEERNQLRVDLFERPVLPGSQLALF